MRTATPLCLLYSINFMDKIKSLLFSNRITFLYFSLGMCFVYVQNDPPSSAQMDGPCVKCVSCTLCSMIANEVLCT